MADGLENFFVSQDFPNNIHLLVGKQSTLLKLFTDEKQQYRVALAEDPDVRSMISEGPTPGAQEANTERVPESVLFYRHRDITNDASHD